ncbi:MAG: undecaprenyl-diphosphate phosphatase [Alphaproteobacteria bacterium]|nr:undecaprenyl-diphosphate phosphatase [Alphaproteobacteria bacterium]
MIMYIKAFLLGIIEGLTEFIPVSSTGHLLVFSDLFNFNTPSKDVFIIVIQLGAILAVCYEYRKKLISVLLNLFSDNSEKNKTSWRFASNLLIAFMPSVIIGLSLYKYIKNIFCSDYMLLVIGCSLIIGGLLFMLVERKKIPIQTTNIDQLTFKKSLNIGLFQTLAMIPGVSRSGATIIGGLLNKLDRKTATEFSFFLAIPTMFAATVYDMYKMWSSLEANDLLLILTGFITSYFSALLVIRLAVTYVKKHSFEIFSYYRIIAGMLCIIYFLI